MIGRRTVLRMFGAGALAGRQAAEAAAKELAFKGCAPMSGALDALDLRRPDGGFGTGAPANPAGPQLDWLLRRKLRDNALRAALRVPAVRAEVESAVYEEQRQVYALDPDLAALKAPSLMAKITWQRQRNVARQLEWTLMEQSPWQRVRAWADGILGPLGLR